MDTHIFTCNELNTINNTKNKQKYIWWLDLLCMLRQTRHNKSCLFPPALVFFSAGLKYFTLHRQHVIVQSKINKSFTIIQQVFYIKKTITALKIQKRRKFWLVCLLHLFICFLFTELMLLVLLVLLANCPCCLFIHDHLVFLFILAEKSEK